MKVLLAALVVAGSLIYPPDSQAVDRSSTERAKFAKMSPCPADGVAKYYNCKGYNIDVVKPICAGGSDTADNFQWLTIKHKKVKDKVERAVCECLKKQGEAMCPTVTWKFTPEPKK